MFYESSRPPYPNELYHYGVKGMKWGKHLLSKAEDYITKTATVALGPKEVAKTITGAAYPAIDRLFPKQKTTARLDDDFSTFIRNDIHDRIGSKINKTNSRAKKAVNNIVNDERFKSKVQEALTEDYKNPAQAVVRSFTDPKNTRAYVGLAADAFVPTYKKSKAKLNDDFSTFMKNDIKDRINDAKKSMKKYGVNKITNSINRVLKDPRMTETIDSIRNNPNDVRRVAQKNKSKYLDVALDAAVPTYKKSKAKLNDDFSTFMKNDIKDRINDAKKVGKKKVKKLLKKFFK
jgi:hypothetical protein